MSAVRPISAVRPTTAIRPTATYGGAIGNGRLTSFPAVRLLATNVSFGRIEPTGDRKAADGPPDGAVRGLLVLDFSVRYGPIAVERYRPNVVHLRNGDRGDLKR
jgi:hypothetical protein